MSITKINPLLQLNSTQLNSTQLNSTQQSDSTPFFKTAYSPSEPDNLSFPENELPFGRTKQSFQDETDINHIMDSYLKTGLFEYVNQYQPQYGDVSAIDFQESMFLVKKTENMFNELPADMRLKFDNNPANFLDYIQNPVNQLEASELGLLAMGEGVAPSVSSGAAPSPIQTQPEGAAISPEPKK